jgi:HEPN domain-containing protein
MPGAKTVNRAELQQLATVRLREAKALLAAKEWAGAYYLAGHAVEIGLKSCILAYVERTGIIFEDRRYAEKCWTHDLGDLLSLARLDEALGRAIAANPTLEENWTVVKDWDESSRYRRTPHQEAKKLYRAIADKKDGIMSWIMNHW